MDYSFYPFLSRMKYINRWALMRNTNAESLSQHSHEVAAVSYALAVIGNRRLGKNYDAPRAALLGLFHDMPEILTGDLPTPVKYYNNEIKSAYDEVEKTACEKLIDTLPEDMRDDFTPLFFKQEDDIQLWKLVKAADKISALIKCVEERKAGNTEFSKAEESTLNAIKELGCPEADGFINDFMHGYELTLDQL